ncbi:MAG: FHA domain-containing protein, partial [Acidobacteriota bacterium]
MTTAHAHAQALPQPGPSTPQSDDSLSPPSLGGAPSPRVGLHRGGVLVLRRELPEGLQLILGRTPECDLRLSHPTVSRTHARLWNDGGEVYVEDLGTVHGTWLHGERIEGRRRLVDGDTLHLGQSGAEGHVLRLEDPAMGLLRELGLLGARGKGSAASVSEDDGVEPVADPVPESAPGAEPEGAPSSDRPAAGENPEPVPTPGVAAALVRNPFAWAGAILALSLVSAMAWGLHAATPTAVGWRWVHLSPPEVAGGVNLALDSPDIRGGSQVELTLGGFDLPAQIVPGRVSADIPVFEGDDLDIGGRFDRPGRYDMPLVARTAGVEVFRATLGYVVTPRIDAVEPPSAEVGEEVTVLGRRFGGEGEVEVRVGNAPAEVLEASDRRLRVRVPAVGGGRTARRHLSVAVGPWRARSAAPLEIRAQPPEAAPPLFTAAKDRGRWRVRPRVGPA